MSEHALLEIADGLKIGLRDGSRWFVVGRYEQYDLADTDDFFRVWVLLERPYSEARKFLDEFATRIGAKCAFPMLEIVRSALKGSSREWLPLALQWIPSLPIDERLKLEGLLADIQRRKWIDQKTRHQAKAHLKHLRA